MIEGDIGHRSGRDNEARASLMNLGTEYQIPFDNRYTGGSLLARLNKTLSAESELQLQAYSIYEDRRTLPEVTGSGETFDAEAEYHTRALDGHDVVLGVGARNYRQQTDGGFSFYLEPRDTSVTWYSAFVQDQITIVKGTLDLVLGTKVERYSEVSGSGWQPTVRGILKLSDKASVWGGVSRALHYPSICEQSCNFSLSSFPTEEGVPGLVQYQGSQGLDELVAWTYEVGYRHQISSSAVFDGAVFYSVHDGVRTDSTGEPEFVETPEPLVIVPATQTNGGEGEFAGVDLSLDVHATDWWRTAISYSYVFHNVWNDETSQALPLEDRSAPNTLYVRNQFDLTNDIELDFDWRYVDSIGGLEIPAYHELDARFGFRVAKNVELSVTGQNLLHSEHEELQLPRLGDEPLLAHSEYQRGVFGKVSVTF
jgi:iron complex outermembrane receptor protein